MIRKLPSTVPPHSSPNAAKAVTWVTGKNGSTPEGHPPPVSCCTPIKSRILLRGPRAANPYYAACTRRVSLDVLRLPPTKLSKRIQLGSSRTESLVRILHAQSRSLISAARRAGYTSHFVEEEPTCSIGSPSFEQVP